MKNYRIRYLEKTSGHSNKTESFSIEVRHCGTTGDFLQERVIGQLKDAVTEFYHLDKADFDSVTKIEIVPLEKRRTEVVFTFNPHEYITQFQTVTEDSISDALGYFESVMPGAEVTGIERIDDEERYDI